PHPHEKSPPRIGLKIEIYLKVPLDYPGGLCTVQPLVRNTTLDAASSNRLETAHDLPNERISLIFKLGEYTSSEEHL
ncbi:hypothetical protein LTR16_011990, partial [Cryomyces antarcticus]